MRRLISSLLFSLTISIAHVGDVTAAPKNYGNAIVEQVTSIYDGDTFRATIQGWPALIGEKMSIRLNGIDTPEMRGKCPKEKQLARQAKQHTVALLRAAKVVELKNMQRGKYFRIVADVYVDNVSLTQSLINANFGVPYFGKTKAKNWCS